jgi:Flp pilus assembly protein TadG
MMRGCSGKENDVKLFGLLGRFTKDRAANVAVIFALAAIPLTFFVGMGIDYTLAANRQAQLNAAADAAALSAVTPTMMAQSLSIAKTKAQNTFNAQANAITGITYNSNNLTVNITTSGSVHTVTVSYTATSQNTFPNVLGMSTFALSGSAQATAGLAPNIDFYLLLDDSPSMAIAATQTGINTLVNNTASQGGCAFACHQTHPSSDNLGNPGGEDNYQLARNLGVTLRIDLLKQAAQNLMTSAQSTESTNNASYRMAIYTFDTTFNTIGSLTSNLTTAKTAAGNISMLTVYANNWLTSNNNNSDTDTNYDNAMNKVNAAMPDPGSGTNTSGDTPQEVLFIVTDGVEDEMVSGSRQQSLMDNGWCNTIKGRGIRIAVLYTTYLPLPTNDWYNTYISPFQANIDNTLSACASPGLYYEVQTGGDISAAMIALFQLAVQSAYLSK